MANEEQLSILKQGVDAWNEWRLEGNNYKIEIDLRGADFRKADLRSAYFFHADLSGADFRDAILEKTDFYKANLSGADLSQLHSVKAPKFEQANLRNANLTKAHIEEDLDFGFADLSGANLTEAYFSSANFNKTKLTGTNFNGTLLAYAIFRGVDLSETINLENVYHHAPSFICTDTLQISKGKIPYGFLRGCGLQDWEIESAKLYSPELSSEEINRVLYKVYDLRASQAIQISPLFISYSHTDSAFVDKIDRQLNEIGVRFWRDIHDMKSGRMEKQIDRALRLNPTVLLILSEHSLQSDWVEHEVRTARALEKELKRDVLCPVALDDSWKNSPWAKRIMEQIMEYNILDFSKWNDDTKFENTFKKLIDGLELFYK